MTHPPASGDTAPDPLLGVLATLAAAGHLSAPDLADLSVRLRAAGVTVQTVPTSRLDLSALLSLTLPELPEDSVLDPLTVMGTAYAACALNLIAVQGHAHGSPLMLAQALADELLLVPRRHLSDRQLNLFCLIAELMPGGQWAAAAEEDLLIECTRRPDGPVELTVCASGEMALRVHHKLELSDDPRARSFFPPAWPEAAAPTEEIGEYVQRLLTPTLLRSCRDVSHVLHAQGRADGLFSFWIGGREGQLGDLSPAGGDAQVPCTVLLGIGSAAQQLQQAGDGLLRRHTAQDHKVEA